MGRRRSLAPRAGVASLRCYPPRMPYYQLMIQGNDVRLFTHGLSEPIVGFFTTKRVFAGDALRAQEIASAEVLVDWGVGGEFESGGLPNLTIETVQVIPAWRALFKRKPRGYTFYMEDPPEEEQDAPGAKAEPVFYVLEKKS